MSERIIEAQFQPHLPARDPWVTHIREKHGLAANASLNEIKPFVKRLWGDVSLRHEAIELVLDRRVDSSEPGDNPDLANVFITDDASKAFGGLLLIKTLEELNDEPDEH